MIRKIHKKGEKKHFSTAVIVIMVAIAVSLIAFMTEENKLTGFVVVETVSPYVQPSIVVYNDVNDLSVLSPGNYYIDANGYVYWLDDTSSPVIARVDFVEEDQKNTNIYIDSSGNVGYLIS